MSRLDEITAEMLRRGLITPTPTPEPQEQQSDSEQSLGSTLKGVVSSAADNVAQTVSTIAKNPLDASLAVIRGTEKAFLDLVPGVVEHLEAAAAFPVIRGAELAARAFVPDDMEPELTSYKEMVAESYTLTKALQQRVPGLEQGVEYGVAVASGIDAAFKFGPKAFKGGVRYLANMRAAGAKKGATKLAKTLLREGDGPVLDAVINRPEKVLNLIKNDAASVDDLAVEVGQDIKRIETKLGEAVGKFRADFKVDPTKKVDITNVRQILADVTEATTSSDGVNLLSGRQKARLELIDTLTKPKQPTMGPSHVPGTQALATPTILPSDALKTIDKIDEMINIKEIEAGNISADAMEALIRMRKELKAQIRGNNDGWVAADNLYSDFKEQSVRIASQLSDTSLSRESFVNNLFGANKSPTRQRLGKVLDYAKYVDDSRVGSGDAFFRRLADIKGAQRIQEVQAQITDPIQDNMNRITRFWAGAGAGVGATIGGATGALLGASEVAAASAGATVGGFAGARVGKMMANPMRVLNKAIKAKELSTKARMLAADLSYVHQNFGNDGVVAFLDVVRAVPAAKELVQFGANIKTEKE